MSRRTSWSGPAGLATGLIGLALVIGAGDSPSCWAALGVGLLIGAGLVQAFHHARQGGSRLWSPTENFYGL